MSENPVQTYARFDISNDLITRYGLKKYLEIGCNMKHRCFDKILAEDKISVDIRKRGNPDFLMSSDEFFNVNNDKFDIVFVDGLHTAEQAYKDIVNSLSRLNEGGYIVTHDCNPLEEEHQTEEKNTKIWNGTVWKAWVKLRAERDDLTMAVIDTDHGCGVIKRGSQEKIEVSEENLNWANFVENRKSWLNLITPEEFKSTWL